MSSTVITDIKIKHSGNFIIDTIPPDGSVLINGGENYTKSNHITVSLDADDVTTGIKDIEARNVNITRTDDGEEEEKFNFIPLEYSESFLWSLQEDEGIKKVEVKLRDYANNISEYIINSSNRKFFSLSDKTVEKLARIGLNVYSSAHGSDGKIYETRNFPILKSEFEDQQIKDIVVNNNVLYVATDGLAESTIYGYIDGEFVVLNNFSSDIINMTSYDGDLYTILENRKLYKKDGSAWFVVKTFARDVSYIAADEYYLYVFFDDDTQIIEIYNGVSFSEVDIFSADIETESDESSSDSSSTMSSSSTREDSSSSITKSVSSGSSLISSSSQSESTSSTSTELRSSSESSLSSSDSSSLMESSNSSPSSESVSSESYMNQFSDSSDTSLAESSSDSSTDDSSDSSNSSSSDSSSSGNPCDCGAYVSSSIYVGSFDLRGMTDKYTSGCNLFGRMVNIGGGLSRVLFYKDIDKSEQNEVARSIDFFSSIVPQNLISIQSSNSSGITGFFNYVAKFAKTTPHNFVILCEGNNTSSNSSSSSLTLDSEITSSHSQDVMLGNGSQTNPFRVTSASHLALVNANPNAYYRLEENIYLDSVSNFIPIGTQAVPFSGEFDGAGLRVYYLNVDRQMDNNVGLFGYVSDATIKNLEVVNCSVVGNKNVGAVIGYMNGGVLKNSSSGSVIIGNKYIGGLVGKCVGGAKIIDCYSKAIVNGSDYSGGLIGGMGDSTTIMNVYSIGPVSGGSNSGGLVGYGFTESEDIGGVISSYWDVETSGRGFSNVGIGKNTSQMKSQSTYIGWDFIDIWSINSGINDGYPYLQVARNLEESSSMYPSPYPNITIEKNIEINW